MKKAMSTAPSGNPISSIRADEAPASRGRGNASLPRSRRATKTESGNRPANGSRVGSDSHNQSESNGHLDGEQILSGLLALKKGNFATKLPLGWTGISGKVADAFNEVAELMAHSSDELSRISRVVGKEGG